MGDAEKTYSDTADQTILSMTPADLFDHWNRFEDTIFNSLLADNTINRGILLNAGAGRRITETEAPFFDSFTELYLLEPDDERRTALANAVKGRNATLVSDRIEEIDVSMSGRADFVQCKYVLQHIHTDLLPLAMERLKLTVAENGVIGIFSASSPNDSHFRLGVPEDSWHLVPTSLKGDLDGGINEAQFNQLMSNPQLFPFIATHNISQKKLLKYFAGWDPTIEISSFGACFLKARKPNPSKKKGFFIRLKTWLNP